MNYAVYMFSMIIPMISIIHRFYKQYKKSSKPLQEKRRLFAIQIAINTGILISTWLIGIGLIKIVESFLI